MSYLNTFTDIFPCMMNISGNTSYFATDLDEYIGVNCPLSTTITLPTGIDGRIFSIKNEFETGCITIKPKSSEEIEGMTQYVLSLPYQSITIIFRSGSWKLI